jgi:hypothetical protein
MPKDVLHESLQGEIMITLNSLCRITKSSMLIGVFALSVVATSSPSHAQTGRVPTPARHDYAPQPKVVTPQKASKPSLGIESKTVESTPAEQGSIDFGSVPLGRVAFAAIGINSTNQINVDIQDKNGADPSPQYKYVAEVEDDSALCQAALPAGTGLSEPPSTPSDAPSTASGAKKALCQIVVIGFMPADDHSVLGATVKITEAPTTGEAANPGTGSASPINLTYNVTGQGSASACLSANSHVFFPLNRGLTFDERHETILNSSDYSSSSGALKADMEKKEKDKKTKQQPKANDQLPLPMEAKKTGNFPSLPPGVSTEAAFLMLKYFDDPLRKLLVNCFYTTNSLFSDFNQFQSIYNSAAGSTSLNVQIGSLNFINGIQFNFGTNPQVGASSSSSNGSTSSTTALRFSANSNANPFATAASTIPTLSAASTAQATQNILNGGTVFGTSLYPVFFRGSTYSVATLSLVATEGVDLQKFNNTSITATNPSTHTFVGLQTYIQFTSANDAKNSTSPAGSIFISGKYGYSLMNHSYSEQNGFGGRINSQIAQVGAGFLLNNVVQIAAYRGFGPSQVYVDSTSMAQKTVNNFQTWSVGIAYQKSNSSKSN